MDKFLRSAVKLIARHGKDFTFRRVQEGNYDPATGTVVNAEITSVIKAWQESVIANQYNFPNLIDKEVSRFYIAGNALVSPPEPQDEIVDASDVYVVQQVEKHTAAGSTALWRVIAVKS